MADVATRVCNIPPTFFLDFLSPEEEDTLFVKDAEEEVLFFSISCIFSRRELARIAQYFEVTVPRYHCDGYRSHFRMSSSTFELLAQLLAPSEHIPKGNAFGRRPIEARKQIALTVWALANQETCCQISDQFHVTMSSVSRCISRVKSSATLSQATFFRTLPLSKRPAFSRRREINSFVHFVLFVVHVTSFSSFSSPAMK